jgi:hypothetical protein
LFGAKGASMFVSETNQTGAHKKFYQHQLKPNS